jgi:hypothetical protein
MVNQEGAMADHSVRCCAAEGIGHRVRAMKRLLLLLLLFRRVRLGLVGIVTLNSAAEFTNALAEFAADLSDASDAEQQDHHDEHDDDLGRSDGSHDLYILLARRLLRCVRATIGDAVCALPKAVKL